MYTLILIAGVSLSFIVLIYEIFKEYRYGYRINKELEKRNCNLFNVKK